MYTLRENLLPDINLRQLLEQVPDFYPQKGAPREDVTVIVEDPEEASSIGRVLLPILAIGGGLLLWAAAD